ncbi:MAG: GNAT family N-acetyltransferase [Cyanobacteria bacterium SZAS LIN-2]|nr:GNAT family N-acetyltransferase [Cyanobacteria bacterium SZAS LIN-3]MBS1996566.1 GNAT family N-acetyltransferase [Cyanobacteria bacterium SZAS LIN-2]
MKLLQETTKRSVADQLLLEGLSIRPMQVEDLPEVRELILCTEGLAFHPWEGEACLARSLERNPGLSQVALDWKVNQGRPQIVGCVFVGEGLMAMVHHLAVRPGMRGQGLATHLVQAGLRRLYHTPDAGRRVYITALNCNLRAQMFWNNLGAEFQARGNLCLFTLNLNAENYPWLE